MSMSSAQQAAFYAASGIHTSSLTLLTRLAVGGVAILCCVLVLIGLMRLLDTNTAYDKAVFLMSIFGMSFVLMMIFIYIA